MFAYRVPAEWEPHEATWLTWPINKITWPGRHLKIVESIYIQMMQALLPGEKVHLLVPDRRWGRAVLRRLESKKARTSNLILHQVKTVDTWIRDYGPIFVKRRLQTADGRLQTKNIKGGSGLQSAVYSLQSKIAFTKWIFNAWGGKYKDLARDDRVVDRVSFLKHYERTDVPMVLEGGSVDVNGQGICLTTEQCLLNPNRNPKLSKQNIEDKIKKFLGVEKIIWLKEGIEGDDTDGHVDDITRFVAPHTILTAIEPDTRDKNHGVLKQNLEILKASKNLSGKKFKIHEFPMPGRVEVEEGHSSSGRPLGDARGRLPASYVNFYIGNGVVLLPVYSHRNDKLAVSMLKKFFPERQIIPVECTSLVFGLGSIHCVTQQQPA